jgi:uncharacterized protein YjcR
MKISRVAEVNGISVNALGRWLRQTSWLTDARKAAGEVDRGLVGGRRASEVVLLGK